MTRPTVTNLAASLDAADSTTYTTASIAPTGRSLLILTVTSRQSPGNPPTPTTVAGLGLDWTLRKSVLNPGNVAHRISVYTAPVPSEPPTGTVAFTFSATQSGATWIIDQCQPCLGVTNVVSGTQVAGTSVTAAFGAFAYPATSVAYAAVVRSSSLATITPRAGWTEIAEQAATDSSLLETQYLSDDDTDVQATASLSSAMVIVGLELLLRTSHDKSHDLWSTDHPDVDTTDTPEDADLLTWDDGASVWVSEPRDAIHAYHEGVRPTETAANNATRLQDVIDGSANRRIVLPYGDIEYDTTLELVSNLVMTGYGPTTAATRLMYQGADATNAIQHDAASDVSKIHLSGFQVRDDRTSPTSGYGIMCGRLRNMCRFEMLLVAGFPTAQIRVSDTTAGSSVSDCIDISNLWLSGPAGSYGLWLQRIAANCRVDHIQGDSVLTSGTVLDALVHLGTQSQGQGVISLGDMKMETNSGAHVLDIGSTFAGNLVAHSLSMLAWGGDTTSSGGDVVHLASTQGSYVFTNLASKSAGIAPTSTNLINDTAAGVTYGAGMKSLAMQVIQKNDPDNYGVPAGVFGGLDVKGGQLGLPEGGPFGRALSSGAVYSPDASVLLVADPDGVWRGVEVS